LASHLDTEEDLIFQPLRNKLEKPVIKEKNNNLFGKVFDKSPKIIIEVLFNIFEAMSIGYVVKSKYIIIKIINIVFYVSTILQLSPAAKKAAA